MTTNNLTLYRLLVKFGASEAEAETAATVVDATTVATKADLHALEAALAWKLGGLVVGAMIGMTGIFALIVRWFVQKGG